MTETTQLSKSYKGLFSELAENVSTLFRKELELTRAEASEKVTQVGLAVGAIAVGALVAMAALIVLLQALVIGVTNLGIAPGWSALIVGGATAVIALILVRTGMSSLKAKNLMPSRTMTNLQRDAQTVKEHIP